MAEDTAKKTITTVTINSVQFITNLKGTLVPLFYIDDNEDLKKSKLDLNSLMFSDLEPIHKGYNVGTKLLVEFSKEGHPTVKDETINPSNKPVTIPISCNTCSSILVILKEEIGDNKNTKHMCPNLFCPATSRNYIYTLFSIAMRAQTDVITYMLNRYPIGSNGPGSVDTIEELGMAMEQIEHKETAGRLQHWAKVHGDVFGEKLWGYELEMDKFLKGKTMKTEHFWLICNFKHITEAELEEILLLNPKTLIQGNEKIDKLSKRPLELLEYNLGFVMWLLKFFEKHGEKEWIESEKR